MPIIGVLSFIKTNWKIGLAFVGLVFVGYLLYKIQEQKLIIADKKQEITELLNDNSNLKNLNEKNKTVIENQKTSISKAVTLVDDLEKINQVNSQKSSVLIANIKREFEKCKTATTIIRDLNCSNIKIKQVGVKDEIYNSISNIGNF